MVFYLELVVVQLLSCVQFFAALWAVAHQHHSSKASVLQCITFLLVQLSHPYTSTGKTVALTIGNFIGKVMSLLF